MITVETSTPSPEPPQDPSLADLSRNASVISSSSSGSASSLLLKTPRPRPIRTFSSPRSRSPGGPTTPRASRPPAYLTRELGFAEEPPEFLPHRQSARAQSNSKSRSSSANGRLSAEDFEFGEVLGEGSYSTVRLPLLSTPLVFSNLTNVTNRFCMSPIAPLDKSTLSKSSTRATSSATTSSRPPTRRKTPSSDWARAIQASFVCTGPFRTTGAYVRLPSERNPAPPAPSHPSPRFCHRPREERRTPVSDISPGVSLDLMRTLLRRADGGRSRLHARKRRDSSVRPRPPSFPGCAV